MKAKHNMVQPNLYQIHFNKCYKDIPSIGNKTFPRTHKLYKICNHNTVKLMNNMSKNHQGTISHIKTMQTKCNCRKKAECLMERNCQVNDIIYNCDIARPFPKTCTLDLQRENGRAVFITTSYYLNTRIQIRQHFQVTCGIWKVLQVKHQLTVVCFERCTSIFKYLKKCLLCFYGKLEIFTYQNQKKLLNKRSELLCKCCHETSSF